MVHQSLDRLALTFRLANNTANFGQTGIGTEELQLAKPQWTERGLIRPHQRRDGDQPAAIVPQHVDKTFVVPQQTLASEIFPPKLIPDWRGEGRPGRNQ